MARSTSSPRAVVVACTLLPKFSTVFATADASKPYAASAENAHADVPVEPSAHATAALADRPQLTSPTGLSSSDASEVCREEIIGAVARHVEEPPIFAKGIAKSVG